MVTICSPGFTNSVCLVNVTAVNEAMDAKYDSCIASRNVSEEIGLAWRPGSSEKCDTLPQVCSLLVQSTIHTFTFQVTRSRCDTTSPVGISSFNNDIAPVRIHFGGTVPNASVAVKVEQYSFVFVFVFVSPNDLRIRGVSD